MNKIKRKGRLLQMIYLYNSKDNKAKNIHSYTNFTPNRAPVSASYDVKSFYQTTSVISPILMDDFFLYLNNTSIVLITIAYATN